MEDWSTLQKIRDLLWDCTDEEYADCEFLIKLFLRLGPRGRKWLFNHSTAVMRVVHWFM